MNKNNQTPQKPVRDLSESERQKLREDGVICARQVLQPEWISRISAAIEVVDSTPSPISELVSIRGRGFMGDLFMWMNNDEFRAVVFESPMALIARQALSSDSVTHWYDQLFVKEAGADVPTPWHHDLTFWPIAGEQIISLWIPCDSVTRASSGLEFIRGSHLWPQRFKAITPDYNEFMINPALDDLPDIESNRDDYDLLGWDMNPGDVLIFHPLIVHGSSGNASATNRRRALASRWAGEDVIYDPKPHTMPLPREHGLAAGARLGGPVFPRVL